MIGLGMFLTAVAAVVVPALLHESPAVVIQPVPVLHKDAQEPKEAPKFGGSPIDNLLIWHKDAQEPKDAPKGSPSYIKAESSRARADDRRGETEALYAWAAGVREVEAKRAKIVKP